jgi:hypothetical protein
MSTGKICDSLSRSFVVTCRNSRLPQHRVVTQGNGKLAIIEAEWLGQLGNALRIG